MINSLDSIAFSSILETLEHEEITNIFLYSKSLLQLKDEINLSKWESAAEKLSLNIYYCKKSADRLNLNLNSPFSPSGLGQLVELTILSKHSIVIGNL